MPPEPHLTWIAGDKRSREARLWDKWFRQIPRLRRGYQRTTAFRFDPLRSNETASVGLLATAASRSGLLTLTEYVADKRRPGRGRPYKNGRCDLWVADPISEASWSFEVKQHFCANLCREKTLRDQLALACGDAREVDALEADRRFGMLLLTAWAEDLPLPGATIERIESFGEELTYACRLGGGATPVWLLIQDVERDF